MQAALQVREKEDRHQQQKIRGFLQPVEDIQAARAAAAAADMEVGHHPLITPSGMLVLGTCKQGRSRGPSGYDWLSGWSPWLYLRPEKQCTTPRRLLSCQMKAVM